MADAGQIKIIGSNKVKRPLYPLVSSNEYVCANAQITKGYTAAPDSLEYCFEKFPKVKQVAEIMGITSSDSLWTGPGTQYDPNNLNDIYLPNASEEMTLVKQNLGEEWLGCYWPAPDAPFSTNCPDINSRYEAYLKLRLNIATFWYTPKETPVKRREFLDSLKYARKMDIVISGDLNLKIGDVVYVKADNISGYPYSTGQSVMNNYYWVLGVKHTFTNSGTHETMIRVSQIYHTFYANAPSGSNTTVSSSGGGFNLPGIGSSNPTSPFTPPGNDIWS